VILALALEDPASIGASKWAIPGSRVVSCIHFRQKWMRRRQLTHRYRAHFPGASGIYTKSKNICPIVALQGNENRPLREKTGGRESLLAAYHERRPQYPAKNAAMVSAQVRVMQVAVPEASELIRLLSFPKMLSPLTEDLQIVLGESGDVTQIHKTFDFVHATNWLHL
jgi:hypothetical protein